MMSYLEKFTIRNRMILFNILTFAFICLMAMAYSYQLVSIEENINVLEEFHNLFDNVLEVRRHEKNFFLNVDSENIKKILESLCEIRDEINRQEGNISRKRFQEFSTNLDSYRSIFVTLSLANSSNISPDKGQIRLKGKQLVVLSRQLLNDMRQRIRDNLYLERFSFILSTGFFYLFIFCALHLQAKGVLDRIAFVQQATKSVVEGNFEPIDYNNKLQQDEIADLTRAFNKMASELDSRQEQLIQSRKLAAIGTFSSGIAHELNNPLNNILLSADTLLEDFSDLSEEEKEIITDIITQTERASEVVKNLLDFSRDKRPSAQLLKAQHILASTRKLIANELLVNAICLEEIIPETLPCIMGDLQNLQQVFLNLFVNSIHVMPEGGVICINATEEPHGYIRINISDTGTGIEPENIEHIFDPFYTTKEVGKGTGLGLSIVYGIVKKHGGYIEVKSNLNVGTTFSIFLPVATEIQS